MGAHSFGYTDRPGEALRIGSNRRGTGDPGGVVYRGSGARGRAVSGCGHAIYARPVRGDIFESNHSRGLPSNRFFAIRGFSCSSLSSFLRRVRPPGSCPLAINLSSKPRTYVRTIKGCE